MHGRKGCDEPEPKFTSQGLQEERHNAMIANGGIAANSSHSLLVRPSARCAFFILMGDWGGGYSTYAFIRKNDYYMRRNLIQIYYSANFGGIQLYMNNRSRN